MGKVIEDKARESDEGIIHHQEQNNTVDLIPSNKQLSGIEVTLNTVMGKEQILKTYLNSIKDRYDYIIIDTPPWPG